MLIVNQIDTRCVLVVPLYTPFVLGVTVPPELCMQSHSQVNELFLSLSYKAKKIDTNTQKYHKYGRNLH